MIQAPSEVTNKFDQSSSINIGVGATLDINCNTLVSFSDDDFTGANYYTFQETQPILHKVELHIEHIVRQRIQIINIMLLKKIQI